MKSTFLPLMLLTMTSFPVLSTPDFSPNDDRDFDRIKSEILEIVENPSRAAEAFFNDFASRAEYGWEHEFLPRLRTLEVVAYLIAIEKAQYYASAGRWTPPDLPWINPLMRFYTETLNPDHRPYSWGVLQDPLYKFSEEFLVRAIERAPRSKTLKLLMTLLQGRREHWLNMIKFYVVPHKAITVADLDLLLGVDGELTTDWVRTIMEKRPTEEVENLLSSYFARASVEGKLAKSLYITNSHTLLSGHESERQKTCAEILTRVRARFSEE